MNIWSAALFSCQRGHDGSLLILEKKRKDTTPTDPDPPGDCSLPPPASSSLTRDAPELNAPLWEYADAQDNSGVSTRSETPSLALRTLNQQGLTHLADQHLHLASSLYLQPCDDTHWLICNPLEGGHIAAIDTDVRDVLAHFTQPTTPRKAATDANVPLARLLPVARAMLNMSFLHNPSQPSLARAAPAETTLSAWLHITNACNLSCPACYIAKSSEHMEPGTTQQSIDALMRSAVMHGYTHIFLRYAGGEAMLRFSQVLAAHDYATQHAQEHQLTLSALLLSNGSIMTQRMIEQLKERHIRVMISLDGLGATHDQQRPFRNGQAGSFALADRTIARLLVNDLRPSINVTVSQRTIPHIQALLAYILERGLRFNLSYYRETEQSASLSDLRFAEDHIIDGMRAVFAWLEQALPRQRIIDGLLDKASLQVPHQYACGAGRNYLVINQRGEVSRCQADMKHTVTTIQAHDILHEVQQARTGPLAIAVEKKEGCRSCSWRAWCRGGCPLVTYRATGRNDLRSPYCAIYQALFPLVVRLEALRLLAYQPPLAL